MYLYNYVKNTIAYDLPHFDTTTRYKHIIKNAKNTTNKS